MDGKQSSQSKPVPSVSDQTNLKRRSDDDVR